MTLTNAQAIARIAAVVRASPDAESPLSRALTLAIEALEVMGELSPEQLFDELVRLRAVEAYFREWFPGSYAEFGDGREDEDGPATVQAAGG